MDNYSNFCKALEWTTFLSFEGSIYFERLCVPSSLDSRNISRCTRGGHCLPGEPGRLTLADGGLTSQQTGGLVLETCHERTSVNKVQRRQVSFRV